MKQKIITELRMKRQCLSEPADEKTYDRLFHYMSPVPTVYWCEPGSPPTLPLHADFDDYAYNSKRRSCREILKGRFGGGSIAYVMKEDLEVYACLYKKEIDRYSGTQTELMELLWHEGPMNIGLMKEFTGLRVKDITPVLHRLQQAFIVYEDQVDNEGDRSWYLFESEFPEINLSKYTRTEALRVLLPGFAYLCVFFGEEMVKSYYKLPVKLIKEVLQELVNNKVLKAVTLDEVRGYMLNEDYDLLQEMPLDNRIPSVILLQRNDFLVRACAEELKARFTSEWDTLYYIVIDGKFYGAVMGRFKFGPHVIEDIVLDLTKEELKTRKKEVIKAVYQIFDPESSPIKRINGIPV